MLPPESILELREVTKNYKLESGDDVTVLTGISLRLRKGESLAVVGPSGCGKSTLLNIIGTLDKPSSGTVLLEGVPLNSLNEESLAKIRNEHIGFIFQAHHLLPQCSVLENVLVPTLASKNKALRAGAKERGIQLLKRVGLGERLSHRPGQISGGERQRVAVVRALINQPKLLLADEPTGALDRVTSQELAKLLCELNREENVTLVLVTHALDLAARMQRQIELRDGKLVN
ncbi:MAG: ABC transporter ATP-binding protein [Verrucomicrobiota bacterium]